MKLERRTLEAFSVIGIEGDTSMGAGFVGKLWQEANSRFSEVSELAAKDENGALIGIWGLMSDRAMHFKPWENDFSDGAYLAGVQCVDNANPPEGWKRWKAPASEYIIIKNDAPDAFQKGLIALKEQGENLIGAAYDFNDPNTGDDYIYYPIRRL